MLRMVESVGLECGRGRFAGVKGAGIDVGLVHSDRNSLGDVSEDPVKRRDE